MIYFFYPERFKRIAQGVQGVQFVFRIRVFHKHAIRRDVGFQRLYEVKRRHAASGDSMKRNLSIDPTIPCWAMDSISWRVNPVLPFADFMRAGFQQGL
jgi:hypothetical protein